MSARLRMDSTLSAVLLGATLSCIASPAQALAIADTSCSVNLGDRLLQTPFDSRSNDGPVSSSCSQAGSGIRFETIPSSGSASGSGFADYGVLKAAAKYQASNAIVTSAAAVASFSDTLTIGSAERDGSLGRARATFVFIPDVEADAAASSETPYPPTSSASVSFTAQIPFGGGVLNAGAEAGDGPEGPSFSQVALRPMDFSFVFGAPFAVSAQLMASVQGNESGDADAGSSLYWGGFEFVQDGAGNAVDYTVSSLSGTDYDRSFAPAAVVPEPGTPVLLIGGALLLAARLRHRAGQTRIDL